MFKKSLSIMLATLLGVSVMMTGCGTNKEVKENVENEKKEAPINLVWYTIGTPQKDAELVEEELNKYLLEKINATVDMKLLDWGEYSQKMQVKVGAGEDFDIMFSCSWANDYASNVAKGAFMPLNDLLEEQGKGILDTVSPLFLEGARIDGEIYAIPTNKELGWQAMWIVNQDLADKYNVDMKNITTLESLAPYLKTIKENEPNVIPLSLDLSNAPYVKNIDSLFGDQLPLSIKFDDPTKIVNTFETEEAMEVFETMYEYYKAGYVHPDAAINKTSDYNKTGNYFITKAHYQPYAEVIWQQGDFSSTPISISPLHEPFANNSSTRGAMQGISINSEHPEKAMEFLNLLYTDEYVLNLLDYGIEGTHYNKIDDFHIEKLDRAQESYMFPSFSIGDVFKTYAYEGTPDDKWEKFIEFNDACIEAPSLGFTPDLSKVKLQMAAVTNVAEEVTSSLYMGVVDPSEYVPKAVQKLKEAGIDEVIAELQTQYDVWFANKNK